jgi:hypothetical protein
MHRGLEDEHQNPVPTPEHDRSIITFNVNITQDSPQAERRQPNRHHNVSPVSQHRLELNNAPTYLVHPRISRRHAMTPITDGQAAVDILKELNKAVVRPK